MVISGNWMGFFFLLNSCLPDSQERERMVQLWGGRKKKEKGFKQSARQSLEPQKVLLAAKALHVIRPWKGGAPSRPPQFVPAHIPVWAGSPSDVRRPESAMCSLPMWMCWASVQGEESRREEGGREGKQALRPTFSRLQQGWEVRSWPAALTSCIAC